VEREGGTSGEQETSRRVTRPIKKKCIDRDAEREEISREKGKCFYFHQRKTLEGAFPHLPGKNVGKERSDLRGQEVQIKKPVRPKIPPKGYP